MEFFSFANCSTTEQDLQQLISIEALNTLCPIHIDQVISHQGNHGEIYCVWGQFQVQRETIYGGVRFSLLNCKNAVTWSITTCPEYKPGEIVIHCTINRLQQDPDFTATIESFIEEWHDTLKTHLA